MTISDSERRVISLLDYFKQATTTQLRSIVFPDSKSRTTSDRVLKKLLRGNYVIHVERRRLVGGGRGGGGEYVWALGPAGWRICDRPGRFRREGAIDYHALTITDLYSRLRTSEREGAIKLDGFTPEPECHLNVGGIYLKPDLLVEVSRANGRRLTSWLEIDMSTQRPARLNEKMDRYQQAYKTISDESLQQFNDGSFPLVVFVCHGDDRQREITWLIERRDDDPRLFRAVTIDNFPLGL